MIRIQRIAALLLLPLLYACITARPPKPQPDENQGLASWYGQEFAGRTTANGEIFDPKLLTAAHRKLPFGTVVLVTNPKNGKHVEVRINDRGPFVGNRIIDLSYAAARNLDMVETGVGFVQLQILKVGRGDREPPAPYVIKIGGASETTPPRPVLDAPPPAVAFPRPAEVAAASEPRPSEEPFRVEVVEERKRAPIEKSSPVIVRPNSGTANLQAGGFVLQAGAFQSRENAEILSARVSQVAKDVFIEEAGGFFRVRAGPFRTRALAIDAQERLSASGLESLIIPLN